MGQVTFNGNNNDGFGGAVGESEMEFNDDGTTVTVNFTKGTTGNLNDMMVIYISTGVVGRQSITFDDNDQNDESRRAITNAFGSEIVFPAGFEANYAIAINEDFGGLFSIPEPGEGDIGNGDLLFVKGVGAPDNAGSASFTFSFDWDDIGLSSSDPFGFVVTYGNPSGGDNNDAMFSSDEGYGEGIPTPNPGFDGWTYETYFEYPTGFTGGNAVTAQDGDWDDNTTWENGNVPIAGDAVTINHNVDFNTDATVSSLTIESGNTFSFDDDEVLSILNSGTLTNDGTFTPNDGNVIFAGAGSVAGSEDVTFYDVEIGGGVVLRGSSTIGNSLTINPGGYLAQEAGGAAITDASNVPDYDTGATLVFATTFENGGEPDSGFGDTTEKTPDNVTVLGGARLRLVDYPSESLSIDFLVEDGGTLELADPDENKDFEHDVTISGVGINDGGTDRGAIWKTASGTQRFNGSITLLENSRINVNGGTLDYREEIDLGGNTLYLGGTLNHLMGATAAGVGSFLTNATKTDDDGAIFKDGTGFFQVRPSGLTGSINLVGGSIRTTGTIPSGGLFRMENETKVASHTSTKRTIEKDLLIEGDVFFGSTVGSRNGPLAVSGVVEIVNGASITVEPSTNTLTVNSGALFNNKGTNKNIELTIRRELTGFDGSDPEDGEGWRYISSPVAVNLSDLLAPIWTQGLTGDPNSGDTSEGTPNVYRWEKTTSGNDRGSWTAVTDLNIPATAGEGFMVYVFADDNFDGTPDGNKTLSVDGIEYGDPTVTTNQNTGEDGWTLLGNPYPTSISFENLRNTASSGNIEDAVYVWAPNDATGDGGDDPLNPSGSWLAWSSDGSAGLGDLTDGLIAPFQAFFVENSDGESNVALTFNDAIKTSNFPEFLFKQAPRDVIRMKLAGQGMRNSAWISFSENGSIEQRVSGDAWQLEPMSSDYALLATKKQGVGLMDIAHFPANSELEIPLITEVTRAGTYHLTVTDLELHNRELYLIDLETGESQILTKNMSYEFSVYQTAKAPSDPFAMLSDDPRKTSVDSYRFVISTKKPEDAETMEMPEEITLRQNFPNPFNPTTVISYDLPDQSHVTLEVYDITGRHITTLVNGQVEAGQHQVTFDASNLSSGTYIYRLQAGGVVQSRSLTLIK